jgi:hypothetical protein
MSQTAFASGGNIGNSKLLRRKSGILDREALMILGLAIVMAAGMIGGMIMGMINATATAQTPAYQQNVAALIQQMKTMSPAEFLKARSNLSSLLGKGETAYYIISDPVTDWNTKLPTHTVLTGTGTPQAFQITYRNATQGVYYSCPSTGKNCYQTEGDQPLSLVAKLSGKQTIVKSQPSGVRRPNISSNQGTATH